MANDLIKNGQKYINKMKKCGFSNPQINLILGVLADNQKQMEEEYTQKAYMLFMSIAANVLLGNAIVDKDQLKDIFNECFELFSEINMELLDWDDVIRYNEETAGVTIEVDKLNIAGVDGEKFMKYDGKTTTPTKNKVKAIMSARDTDLKSLESASENLSNEETKLAVKCYRAEYELIMKALKEGGIL